MTKAGIIQEALKKAQLGLISDSETNEYSDTYELTLEALLETQDWIFSYGYNTSPVLSTTAPDLGFDCSYDVSENTVSVEAINISDSYLFTSPEEALRFGYSATRQDLAIQTDSKKPFILVGNHLYSDVAITNYLFRQRVEPNIMTASFRRALIYALAYEFSSTISSDKLNFNKSLEQRAEKELLKAITVNQKRPTDPQLQSIYNWIRQYVVQTNSRY